MNKIPEWLKAYNPDLRHYDCVGQGWVHIADGYRDELMAKILLLYPDSKITVISGGSTIGIANSQGELILWGFRRTMLDLKLL